jgi:prophage regulatory protein
MKTSRPHSSANDSTPIDPSLTLIRIAEVMAIVGLARPTIYKLMNEPESGFPKTVKLTNSNARGAPVAWVLSEVQAWTRGRIEARDEVAA